MTELVSALLSIILSTNKDWEEDELEKQLWSLSSVFFKKHKNRLYDRFSGDSNSLRLNWKLSQILGKEDRELEKMIKRLKFDFRSICEKWRKSIFLLDLKKDEVMMFWDIFLTVDALKMVEEDLIDHFIVSVLLENKDEIMLCRDSLELQLIIQNSPKNICFDRVIVMTIDRMRKGPVRREAHKERTKLPLSEIISKLSSLNKEIKNDQLNDIIEQLMSYEKHLSADNESFN